MGRFIPPYDKCQLVSLVGTVVSITVLIITLYCVYYPYLETDEFFSASCIPAPSKSQYIGLYPCQSPAVIPCTPVPTPNVTLWTDPPHNFTTPLTWANWTLSTLASNMTTTTSSINASSTTSPPAAVSTTRRQRTTPSFDRLSSVSPPDPQYCSTFPCYMMRVDVLVDGVYVYLYKPFYNSYDEMNTYPLCSYSACGANNVENAQAVANWFDTFKGSHQFQCYTDKTRVLQTVNYSYSAAVNSIFWPIVSLIIFGTILIVLRGAEYYKKYCPKQPTTPVHDQAATSDEHPGAPCHRMPPEMAYPPAYYNVASASGYALDFSSIGNEKSPTAGGAWGDVAGYPAAAAPWVVTEPPQYAEVTTDDGAAAWVGVETGAQSRDVTRRATSGDRDSDRNDLRY